MKVRIINESAFDLPKAATDGSSALDLRANIDKPIFIGPQAPAQLIPTGIKLDMSEAEGLMALLAPRSGLGHKTGLVLGNGVGVIDNDYQGELFISAWNRNPAVTGAGMGAVRNAAIKIEPGERIAQLLFMQGVLPFVEFEEVEAFEEETERGEGSFGSTGTEG